MLSELYSIPIKLQVSGSHGSMSDKGMNGKKTTSKRGAVIGGAVAGAVGASGLLAFFIHRHLRKMRTGQQTVVEPLMLPPSNTITQPESADAQYAEDQALTGQIPAVPVLHSASVPLVR